MLAPDSYPTRDPIVLPKTLGLAIATLSEWWGWLSGREPTFTRFCELLAVKESPYLDFLRLQAREARAEQARYLERAADRAYLSMHAPLAPLLAVLVLVLAYGFLRFLSHTV